MALQPKSIGTPTKSFFMAQIILRFLAAAFTLAAIFVLVTAKQSVVVFGIVLQARYDYTAAFRFVLGADAVVCGFSLLSIVFVCILSRSELHVKTHFLLYLHDLFMMLVMISGCAAGTAVGYVSKYGEDKMGWFRLCDKVTKFCNQVTISMVLSYLAFFCYLAMTIMSPRKFMYQVTE
ncbi:hypothetical protein SLA2020_022040 [Shorea laevis]